MPIPSDYALQCPSNSASDSVSLLFVDGYPVGLRAAILVVTYPNCLQATMLIE